MAGLLKIRIINDTTPTFKADESDLDHIDTDFVSGAGVNNISTDFLVTQNTGTGSDKTGLVSLGNAYTRNSSYSPSQKVIRFWSAEHSAQDTFTVTPNTTLATRVDYLVLTKTAGAPDVVGQNVYTISVVAGVSSGVAPAVPSNALVLARFDLPLNFTALTNAMITDMRVQATLDIKDGWTVIDKSEDPLAVTGTLAIVQYVSATSIKIFGDWTKILGAGDVLKFTQSGALKYVELADNGIFTSSYTTYNLNPYGIYTVANAVITKVYYSKSLSPLALPSGVTALSQGWTRVTDTWTYSSGSTSTSSGVITIPTDGTQKYEVGDKLSFVQSGTRRYFIVSAVTATTLSLALTSDYTLANSAISDIYYSHLDRPKSFPSGFNYIPTFTGYTLGNGTIDYARYIVRGKTLRIGLKTTLGTTSAVTGSITFTAPIPVNANEPTSSMCDIGLARFDQTGITTSKGYLDLQASSTLRFLVAKADTTYVQVVVLSSTVPHTWGSTHIMSARGEYEI